VLVETTRNGYPRLAAFQSSESNFALYRGFSYLHSRVLLDLQDELTGLERELDEIDIYEEDESRLTCRENDVREGARELQDGSLAASGMRSRRQVMTEIKQKLFEYGRVLFSQNLLDMSLLTRSCRQASYQS
jgi:hypothetical protein